jgi:hypothetical protein
MIIFAGIHPTKQAEMMHLQRGLREQFADMQAGYRSWDGPKWSAGSRARFGVPTLKLTQAAMHVENDNPLLLLLNLFGSRSTR